MMHRPMAPSVDDHLRAAAALMRLMGASHRRRGLGGRLASAIEETTIELATDGPTMRARLFAPTSPPIGAVMLAHGMHHLGGDEPRLVAFGRNLARAGLLVVAPHLGALAAYELDPRCVDQIAAASRATAARIGRTDVGVVGISFGGGAALIAATDPARGASIRFVLCIGAHDDLGRIAGWYLGDTITGPHGERVDATPDPYGLQLLVHDAPAYFFTEHADLARDALALALADRTSEALALGAHMEPTERTLLEAAVLGHPEEHLVQRVRAMLERRRDELAALSPSASLGPRRLPVLLLHGRGDRLIPATESLSLAERLGPRARVLSTSAIGHADQNPDVGMRERIALVRFMAQVFALAR